MTEREPEHIFRVQYYEGPTEYIAADNMSTTTDGIVQLWVKGESKYSSRSVAVFTHVPGLTVTRVDCLITKEGLSP